MAVTRMKVLFFLVLLITPGLIDAFLGGNIFGRSRLGLGRRLIGGRFGRRGRLGRLGRSRGRLIYARERPDVNAYYQVPGLPPLKVDEVNHRVVGGRIVSVPKFESAYDRPDPPDRPDFHFRGRGIY